MGEDWGSSVEVRRNLPVLLAKEARKLEGVVGLGTVTDPYQPVEEKYLLTRYCLEQLAAAGCRVCVQTKSDLVTRDLDILSRTRRAEVGITMTTMDEAVAGMLEPGAPPPDRRAEALRKVSDAGIPAWVFLGPVIHGINDSPESLGRVVDAAARAGARKIIYDRLRVKPLLMARMERAGHGLRISGDARWWGKVSGEIERLARESEVAAERAF
jgi:DNA repair photolyase